MDDKESILEQLREALKHQPESDNGHTVSLPDYCATDGVYDICGGITSPGVLTTGGLLGTVTLSSIGTGLPTGPTVTIPNGGFQFSNAAVSSPWDSGITTDGSGTIQLTGENADIKVNDESLLSMIKEIQDRLSILKPDPKMEAEWDELREIREQYERKLAECKAKSRTWAALKQ